VLLFGDMQIYPGECPPRPQYCTPRTGTQRGRRIFQIGRAVVCGVCGPRARGLQGVGRGVCRASGAGFSGRARARAESRQRGSGVGAGRSQRTQRVGAGHAAAGAAAIAGLRAGAGFAGSAAVEHGVCEASGAGFAGRARGTRRESAERRRGGHGTSAENIESRRGACGRRCSCHCRLEGGCEVCGVCGRRARGLRGVERRVCGARAESRQRGGGAGAGRAQSSGRHYRLEVGRGVCAVGTLRLQSAESRRGWCGARAENGEEAGAVYTNALIVSRDNSTTAGNDDPDCRSWMNVVQAHNSNRPFKGLQKQREEGSVMGPW
jgi:hypothetical protein